jgi:hypothetical protein
VSGACVKVTFIANATNGKSRFRTLEYREPKIRVVGPAAIVRFHWVAESESVPDGEKSSTNLHILMNRQKQGAEWHRRSSDPCHPLGPHAGGADAPRTTWSSEGSAGGRREVRRFARAHACQVWIKTVW